MLLLHGTPGAEKCQEYENRFVNDRLISLMKDFVTDYVEMYDAPYRERITCSADWEKPLEEIMLFGERTRWIGELKPSNIYGTGITKNSAGTSSHRER